MKIFNVLFKMYNLWVFSFLKNILRNPCTLGNRALPLERTSKCRRLDSTPHDAAVLTSHAERVKNCKLIARFISTECEY